MLHAHAYEPFDPVPHFKETVPADLQGIILRCLEKDPERRYHDAMTLDKALAGCESAGEWNAQRAEEWWRRHLDAAPPPVSPEALERDGQTLLAKR
jgi:serine/threonine-protein kinase